MSRVASAQDAIVQSGWHWDAWNVPERIAVALTEAGANVLYVSNAVSAIHGITKQPQAGPGLAKFAPVILSHRLNGLSWLASFQAKLVAKQIISGARHLRLRNPFFVYPHGAFSADVAREMKRKGFFLVHICMDYPEPGQERHVALSDLTLVIPETAYHVLHSRFGDKVKLIPQIGGSNPLTASKSSIATHTRIDDIPRPRLVYLGAEAGRLNLELVRQVLERNPTWHFVTFESSPCLPLPNVHAVQRCNSLDMSALIHEADVGFMPYSCADEKNFHCVPLKTFDYFAAGLPVVSTRIANLSKYENEVYFGDTVEELTSAVLEALQEVPGSAKRQRRIAIAGQHAIGTASASLAQVLSEAFGARNHSSKE